MIDLTSEQYEVLLDVIGDALSEEAAYLEDVDLDIDFGDEAGDICAARAEKYETLANVLETLQAPAGLIDQASALVQEWKSKASEEV